MTTEDGAPLTEAQLLSRHKQKLERQNFIEYLLKQVAEVTYQYNCFETNELVAFATAMEVADKFRSTTMELGKKANRRITSFKTMLETAEVMVDKETDLEFVSVLRRLLDLHGRLRCTAVIAADFLKTLDKTGGDPEYVGKAKENLEQWKGLCLRSFDYSAVPLYQLDQLEPSDEEKEDPELAEVKLKYVAWPLSVRTMLFISGQYLRRASIAADVRLFPHDPTRLRKSMTGPTFVTAYNIDEALFRREGDDAPGLQLLGVTKERPEFLPHLSEVDPKLMNCIAASGALLVLASEPFREPAKPPKKKKK